MMTRSFIIKVFLILISCLASGALIWSLVQKKGTLKPAEGIKEGISYPLSIKGISSSSYDSNGRLLMQIKADEIKVNPRRFFVFNIKSINEVTITNVKAAFYFYEDKTQTDVNKPQTDVDLLKLYEGVIHQKKGDAVPKEFGRITRGVINGFTLEIYRREKLSVIVKANEGEIDFRKKIVEMKDVHLEEVLSKKIIKSNFAVWDNKEKFFKIPGEYIAATPKGSAKAQGLKVDLNFKVEKLN
ncbi:MAG: hypothetical protein A2Z50_03325 [Nitrospirae bacterium RBG_19FT_COMBO_42_15]|nr:MAG: hypothetical protein A2Z50_03325 [Nitrospirae bacterium RBG_19FT_COMBO_42_15]